MSTCRNGAIPKDLLSASYQDNARWSTGKSESFRRSIQHRHFCQNGLPPAHGVPGVESYSAVPSATL